jgi:PAS domain-containing protein
MRNSSSTREKSGPSSSGTGTGLDPYEPGAECGPSTEDQLRESEIWLAGQKEAFQAAMNGAPLPESLNILIRTAIAQIGGDARCAFYRVDANGDELRHLTGMPEDYARDVDGFRIGPDSQACGLAVHTGEPRITADVHEDPLWREWLWLAQKYEYRGCWSFPVKTTAGKVVGTFALYFKKPRAATSRDLEFAAVLTHAAGIIISRHQEAEERARAETVLRQNEQRLRAFLCATSDVVYCMSPDWSEMRFLDGKEFIADQRSPNRGWLDKYIHPDDRGRLQCSSQVHLCCFHHCFYAAEQISRHEALAVGSESHQVSRRRFAYSLATFPATAKISKASVA